MHGLIGRPDRLLLLPSTFLSLSLHTTLLNLGQHFFAIVTRLLLDLRLFINAHRLYLPFESHRPDGTLTILIVELFKLIHIFWFILTPLGFVSLENGSILDDGQRFSLEGFETSEA